MTTLDREELYKQVWEEPMTKLALKYNVSDVGLKKICVTMGIPTPEPGYWAKIKAGKKVVQIPLPLFDAEKHKSEFKITATESRRGVSEELEKEISEILKPIVTFDVPDRIKSYHPLIEEASAIFSGMIPDRIYGFIRGYRGQLNIKVSKNQVTRALGIFNTICKAFDQIHLRVENEKDQRGTYVSIKGEKVHFLIEERFHQIDHILTEKEKADLKKYHYSSAPKFDYVATGELSIRIDDAFGNCRKKWKDGKQKIEEQVGEFFRNIFIVAADRKDAAVKREAERIRWHDARLKEEAEKQKIIEEKKRYSELELQADRFSMSKKIRDYVTHVRSTITEQTAVEDEIKKFEEWEAWALDYVKQLEKLPDALL